jgi:hypothetical protein
MSKEKAGGFEYRGRTLRFKHSQCRLDSDGYLFIDAEGDHCGLRLVGVPFPGAAGMDDLTGRVWEPDDDQLAIHADTFAEGGLEVRDKHLCIMGGRVECRRYDPEHGILTVYFRLEIQDDYDGRAEEADGVAYCRVMARGKLI